MQTPVIKMINFRFEALRVLSLGVSALVFSGCSALVSHPSDAALDAARVKLMEGAITRDQAVIQPLLAPDFVWREDKAPLEEEPYDFWSRHRLWQEFGGVLKQPLVRKNELMIAPKNSLGEGYVGPRVAWRKVGGEWKLAYFLPAPAPAR
jgi:hypothetical protein